MHQILARPYFRAKVNSEIFHCTQTNNIHLSHRKPLQLHLCRHHINKCALASYFPCCYFILCLFQSFLENIYILTLYSNDQIICLITSCFHSLFYFFSFFPSFFLNILCILFSFFPSFLLCFFPSFRLFFSF